MEKEEVRPNPNTRGAWRMNILEFYGMLFLVGVIIDHSINIYLLKKKVRELKQKQEVEE